MPGRQTGHVHVVDIQGAGSGAPLQEGARTVAMLPAHRHAVAGLAISRGGRHVATVSDTGTIVRVFDVRTRACLHELRRGLTAAAVHCLRFSGDGAHLCAASDRSVHVFALRDPARNARPVLGTMLDFVMGSPSPARAFATLATSAPGLCAFAPDSAAVIALCADATWHKFPLGPDAGRNGRGGSDGRGEIGDGKEFARLMKSDASAIFRL